MTRKNPNENLDNAGRRLLNASVLSDQDVEEVAGSPFLFARIRARISERQADEAGNLWGSFWLISRKAIPAMSLAAAISLGLFLYAGNKSQNSAFSVDAYLGTSESGIENIVFAEKRPLTTEEVLTTIITRDEREFAR
ncbi:MAG: hypothetical protein ACREBG_01115 [Pyrinomonadaceae bacterium]